MTLGTAPDSAFTATITPTKKPRKPRAPKAASSGNEPWRAANATPTTGECKCVYNTRTKKSAQLCFVGKSTKSRSGWAFQKGGAQACKK